MSRQWRQKETWYLIAEYGHKSTAEIAEYLGRSVDSVYKRAQRLGLAAEQVTYPCRITRWLKDKTKLEFAVRQLAKDNIPYEIRERTAPKHGVRYAVYRLEEGNVKQK